MSLSAISQSALVAAVFLTACGRAHIQERAADGSVALFNGRDLEGWAQVNCAASTWTVRDGMIVCSGKPTGVLRTERQYQDFELELDWRHMVAGGNAGVFVWSDPIPAVGVPFTRSIEVQVLDGTETADYTSHGDVFSIHGAHMTPDRPHPAGWERCLPSERRANPSPQWNHYKITCNDGRIKLAVNGVEVSGGYDIKPRRGYICLESEGSEVHFKNLRLRELPSTRRALLPDEVASVDVGFKSLYDGVDLDGWKLDYTRADKWRPKDWILAGGGTGDTLWTEATFDDFELIADFRLAGGASAYITLRNELMQLGINGPNLGLVRWPNGAAKIISVPGLHVNENAWNRLEIQMKGGTPRMKLNDREFDPGRSLREPPPAGPIGLTSQGAVEFANLFVRRLD